MGASGDWPFEGGTCCSFLQPHSTSHRCLSPSSLAAAPGMTVSPSLPPHHCSHTYTFFPCHRKHQVTLLGGFSASGLSPHQSHPCTACCQANCFQETSHGSDICKVSCCFLTSFLSNFISQYILSPTARLTSYPSPGQSCLLAGPYSPRPLAFPVTFARAVPSLELSPPLSKSCLLKYWGLNQAPVMPGGSLSLCPLTIPDCLPIDYLLSFPVLKLIHLRWAYLSLLKDRAVVL